MQSDHLKINEELFELCKKWRISKLSVFGSYAKSLQNDLSDVDLLLTFEQDTHWSLIDHIRMKKDFQSYFQKEVDLLSESALTRMKNQNRKEDIIKHLKVIYAA